MAREKEKILKKRTLFHKIVNVFLYTGIAVLIVLLLVLGFSQTSTFREILREKIVSAANKELNGKLSIGKIDGTIFTSLFLRNAIVSMGSDTLFNANLIEVKISPLQIFLKRIYVRKVGLSDTRIALIADSSGSLNISRLLPPTPKDTSHSKFPFKIVAPDLQLKNVSFSLQDYNKVKSNEVYGSFNIHDFRIKDINLSLSALADIADNAYELKINSFSFVPNLKNFALKNLSGEFFVDTNGVYVNQLKLSTAGSDINLKAKIDNLNLFDSTAFRRLSYDPVDINLKTDKFNFDDISSFVPSAGLLKGTISISLKSSGSLKDLNISKLEINYLNTHLEAEGKVRNTIDPDDMFISASFTKTEVRPEDISKLLPDVGIPVFSNLDAVKFDTLDFQGNPFNFFAKAYVQTNKGSAGINASLDLRKVPMAYDINFSSRNLDLSPFVGAVTNLNSRGSIKGSGLTPDNLSSTVRFASNGSSIYGNKIDTLRFDADARNKKINYSLFLKSDTTGAQLAGSLDFSNHSNPLYAVKGFVKNLDVANFTKDSSLSSNMNFRINGSGSSFDLDKMDLFLTLNLDPSTLRGVNIDSARAIFDIRSDDNGQRIINVISDLADVTIMGKFSAKHSVNLLSEEAKWIAGAVKSKLNRIIYPDSVFNRQATTDVAVLQPKNKKHVEIDSSSSFKYSIEFKNFDLLSLLMANSHLSLNGNMDGTVKNDSSGITITSNTKLDYLKFWGGNNVFFLSKLNLGLNLSNNYNPSSLKDISSRLNLTAERVFANNDFKDIALYLKLGGNNADINFHGKFNDKAEAGFSGRVSLPGSEVHLDLDTLFAMYNSYALHNSGNVKINYSRDQIMIDHFELAHNGGAIDINGTLNRTGTQNLKINIHNISGYELATGLFNMKTENGFGTSLYLNAEITGNFSAPLMKINFGADSIKYKNKMFGSLASSLNYENQNLSVDLRFLDSLMYKSRPALTITGNVPVDLSFTGGGDRFSKTEPVDLTLSSLDFNLATFGNILPQVDFLSGKLTSNIRLTGLHNNLEPTGYIRIDNISFIAEANNLQYFAGLRLSLKDNKVSIDSLLVANIANTKNGGQITGSGTILLNNFEPASMNISLDGTLKVLSEASKSVSPNVYGDLSISTDGYVNFSMDSRGYFLNAPLIIKEAKLTFPPSQSVYQNSTENFIYRFVGDTSKKNTGEMDFEHLVQLSRRNKAQESNEENNEHTPFNYVVNIKVQNEAVLKFVLAKEINQSLTAVLSGNLQYENIGGRVNSQGELNLLDGSTLEFFKTFEAAGTIRFESELSNPYLNIVATYKNYYTPPEPDSKEEQVAVKIKLSGPLSDLSQSFIQDKNNIAVYVGADNISNNKPDPTKNVSDAVMFIVTGKFSSDLTPQQQSQALNQSSAGSSGSLISNTVNSATASIAGSLLGGVLNQYLGDYVKGVELRNVGSTTKFNLVGKVKNFRYSIGGSTEVFQDLSQANVRIEYPIFNNFLLRLERKEPVTQTNISNDMINELGLKYRFEF